jgi:hypothetical protein
LVVFWYNYSVRTERIQKGDRKMVYSDVSRFGFIGIIPAPKGANGTYSKNNKAIRSKVTESVKSNNEFVQFALKDKCADHLNEILGSVVEFIIKCNEAYYYFNGKGGK